MFFTLHFMAPLLLHLVSHHLDSMCCYYLFCAMTLLFKQCCACGKDFEKVRKIHKVPSTTGDPLKHMTMTLCVGQAETKTSKAHEQPAGNGKCSSKRHHTKQGHSAAYDMHGRLRKE